MSFLYPRKAIKITITKYLIRVFLKFSFFSDLTLTFIGSFSKSILSKLLYLKLLDKVLIEFSLLINLSSSLYLSKKIYLE